MKNYLDHHVLLLLVSKQFLFILVIKPPSDITPLIYMPPWIQAPSDISLTKSPNEVA